MSLYKRLFPQTEEEAIGGGKVAHQPFFAFITEYADSKAEKSDIVDAYVLDSTQESELLQLLTQVDAKDNLNEKLLLIRGWRDAVRLTAIGKYYTTKTLLYTRLGIS